MMKFHHHRGAEIVHEDAFIRHDALAQLMVKSDMNTTIKKLHRNRIPFDIHIEHVYPVYIMKVYVAKENVKKARRKLHELF
jgi:hypothetical protein